MARMHPWHKGRNPSHDTPHQTLIEYAQENHLSPRAVLHRIRRSKLKGYFAGNRWYVYPDL
jgi:hypothetical protein